ncbi:MAG TPA: Fic family protein, partial [Opitutus sp.]|nr:Fic family protein [Opitutus sp.]
RAAGREPVETAMTKARLLSLQNLIVDPRYAEAGYRTSQNYVGESVPGMREILHYIPPPPDQVEALMTGLAHATTRMEAVPSIIQAASAGFEFVFIHPFDDGNGRLHRFLFQDVLARRGVLPSGTALPISASILADMRAYDDALENFSRGILAQADYELDDNGRLTVRNGMELAPSWRYPDLTRQVEYLAVVMGRAVEQLPKELRFLQRYDVAKGEIRAIVDMPDQRLKSLMSWLEANGGRLSNNKRKQVSELTDDEVQRIHTAYGDAFREEE